MIKWPIFQEKLLKNKEKKERKERERENLANLHVKRAKKWSAWDLELIKNGVRLVWSRGLLSDSPRPVRPSRCVKNFGTRFIIHSILFYF